MEGESGRDCCEITKPLSCSMVQCRPTLPLIFQANDIRPEGDLLLLLEGVQEMIDSLASDNKEQVQDQSMRNRQLRGAFIWLGRMLVI